MIDNKKITDLLDRTGVDYKVIASFVVEMINLVKRLPSGNKENAFHEFFDEFFSSVDMSESFDRKLVIINDEVFTTEMLVSLHNWVSKKCCNIQNIVYIPLSSVGVNAWYQQYLEIFGYGSRGFTIIEAPVLFSNGEDYFQNTNHIDISTKDYKYYYSCYGGTYNTLSRDFLIASLMTVPCPAAIDYLANFTPDRTAIENYFESATSFCDRAFVDQLLKNVDINFDHYGDRGSEKIDFSGFQYATDKHAFAQVVRETNDTDYWGSFTEKTVRAFLHRQAVIPISGYAAKDALVNIGFKFPDIIDYDEFQYESNYGDRCRSLCKALKKLSDNYSLKDLEEYYIANLDLFNYNFEYIQSGEFVKYIKQQLSVKFGNA